MIILVLVIWVGLGRRLPRLCLGPLICMWAKEAAGKITWLQSTAAIQTNTDVHTHVSDWLQETWRKPNFSPLWWGPWERIHVEGRKITVHQSSLMLQAANRFKSSVSPFLEKHSVLTTSWWHMGGQIERLMFIIWINHFIKFCNTFGPKHTPEEGEMRFSLFFQETVMSWGTRAELFNRSFCSDGNVLPCAVQDGCH